MKENQDLWDATKLTINFWHECEPIWLTNKRERDINNKIKNSGYRYTYYQERDILFMHRNNTPIEQIAMKYGRTINAMQKKIRKLNKNEHLTYQIQQAQ